MKRQRTLHVHRDREHPPQNVRSNEIAGRIRVRRESDFCATTSYFKCAGTTVRERETVAPGTVQLYAARDTRKHSEQTPCL